MNGVRYIGSLTAATPTIRYFTGGGAFKAGDFVKLEGTTGEVVVATAGASILGIAMADGANAQVNIPVNVTPDMIVLMDNDQVGGDFVVTDELQFADFTGASNAMLVDTSTFSGTKAQLLCLDYNPQGYGVDSDVSIGKFLVVETAMSSQASA